tara:strand:- start:132 stop:314 length:183 start_codon:yes stop_codon:yes gene_type:complete
MYQNKLQYVPLINLAHENFKISLFNLLNLDGHQMGQKWDKKKHDKVSLPNSNLFTFISIL